MKEFKINTWTMWSIISFVGLIVCWYMDGLKGDDLYFFLIIFLICKGFKSIDDYLGNETNLFKIKWRKRK